MRRLSPKALASLAFTTVGIAWGTTYAGMHVAVESMPPLLLGAVRFTIAGAILMALLRLLGIALPGRRDWPHLAIVGVLLLTCANSIVAWANQYMPSVLVALMINSGPFIYVGLQALFGERVPRRAWLGLGVGFLGLLILVSPQLRSLVGGATPADMDPRFWRALAGLSFGPIFWSLGCLYATRRPVGCHHLMTAATQSFLGGIGALIFAALHGDLTHVTPPSHRSILAICWLIVVGSWLGYVSYLYCVMHCSSPRVAAITYVNNVVAVIVGWLVLGERLSGAIIAGGAVLVVGVGIVKSAESPATIAATTSPENAPETEPESA